MLSNWYGLLIGLFVGGFALGLWFTCAGRIEDFRTLSYFAIVDLPVWELSCSNNVRFKMNDLSQ